MNRYSIPLVAFGLLAGCVTVPPPPLTAHNPASPSAPEAAVNRLRNPLAVDDLTRKTRAMLAPAGKQQDQPSPAPIPEPHQIDQISGLNGEGTKTISPQ